MNEPIEDPGFPRQLARGRAYVYVAPCRGDTLLKIGFSRDPLQRLRTLHRRFFEFFDLDGGVLVAAERVAEARRLERRLLDAFAPQQALEPPIVPPAAAGRTEWFRGVADEAVALAAAHAQRHGLALQRPLKAWLRAELLARSDRLFAWAGAMLDAVEYGMHNGDPAQARLCERALRDALDACRAAGLDPAPFVPDRVARFCLHG
jgi:plasmid stabilization system protein ParE